MSLWKPVAQSNRFSVRLVFSSSLVVPLWLKRCGAFAMVLIICRTPVEALPGRSVMTGIVDDTAAAGVSAVDIPVASVPFVFDSIIVGIAWMNDDGPLLLPMPAPPDTSSPLVSSFTPFDGNVLDTFEERRWRNENDFNLFSVLFERPKLFVCCWLLCRSSNDVTNMSSVPRSAFSLELVMGVILPGGTALDVLPKFDMPNRCVNCKFHTKISGMILSIFPQKFVFAFLQSGFCTREKKCILVCYQRNYVFFSFLSWLSYRYIVQTRGKFQSDISSLRWIFHSRRTTLRVSNMKIGAEDLAWFCE